MTDLAQAAGPGPRRELLHARDLQGAVCAAFRAWERSVQVCAFDQETGVVLDGEARAKNEDVVPRGDVFETRAFPAGGAAVRLGGARGLSPVRSTFNSPRARGEALSVRGNFKDIKSATDPARGLEIERARGALAGECGKLISGGVAGGEAESAVPCGISPEAAYLLRLNFASVCLAFFRTLYPGLAHHAAFPAPAASDADLSESVREEARPASGQTPVVGKLPALLPNLSLTQKGDGKKAEVRVNLGAEDCIVLTQMAAQNLKDAMLQLRFAADSDQMVADDMRFVQNALEYLGQRIHLLNRTGQEIYDRNKTAQVEREAAFYNGLQVE